MRLSLLLAFILFFSTLSLTQAQGKQTKEISLWEIEIRNQLKYPAAERRAGKSASFAIELKLDESGQIENAIPMDDVNTQFVEASMFALEEAKDLWSPELLTKKPDADQYLIVFSFMQQKPNESNPLVTAQSFISKKKYEKALKGLNRAIEKKPYDPKLYDLRSRVYLLLGDEEKFKEDSEKALAINKNVISSFDLTTYTVTTVRTVSGTF